MSAESSATHYRVIILKHDSTALVALPAGAGWRLPGWTLTEARNWEDVSAVNASALQLLGLHVATLRAVALDWTDDRRDSYYLAESLDSSWQPPHGAAWLPIAEARDCTWTEPREGARIAAWLVEHASERRVPWYRPGWQQVVEEWVEGALTAAGLEPAGPVEQLRSWQRCSLYRAPTRDGAAYFKAVPGPWGHEPALTAYLARRFPRRTPEVIAADATRGYMLLAGFGGRPLSEVADLDAWVSAYAALGRMQVELVDRIDDLARLGVPFHTPAEILPRIGSMLGDDRRLRVGLPNGLDPRQVERLRAAEPGIAAACERLATGPIPLSLDHGDFWPGNIQWAGAGPLIFDWSDATLTHPFFSLVMAADEVDAALPHVAGPGRQVIDAYLREWTAYAPLGELRALFADAMLVAPLHQALMYRDRYLPALEFIDELDRMPVVYLRWLARQLERDA